MVNHLELGERRLVKENSFWDNADAAANQHVDLGV
jgi:hypothetical protein